VPHAVRFSIAPVRSLGLEHPDAIDLTDVGVVEDRRFFLADETGRLVDRLVVGGLAQVAAHTDPGATRLRIAFPDGRVLDDEVELGAHVEVPIYGRLAVGHVVRGPWADALSEWAGRRVDLVRCDLPGGTRDGDPVSLISDGSLAELARQAGGGRVDARRFRMLIELEGAAAHEEDTWIGRHIAIGTAVLAVTEQDARCAITTQDPDSGRRDMDTLRMIIAYRGLRDGRYVDFGVLADVARPGRVRLGDQVTLLGEPPG